MHFLLALGLLSTSSLSVSGREPCAGNKIVDTKAVFAGSTSTLLCSGDTWVTSITFAYSKGDSVLLKTAECVEEFCCEKYLIQNNFTGTPALDHYRGRPLKGTLELRCKAPGHKINQTTATCTATSADGDGWDILGSVGVCEACPPGTSYDSLSNTCPPCPVNTFSNGTGAATCTPCNSATSFTADVGATQCECKRGLLRHPGIDGVCEFCPAGHTTYRGHPGVCVGPQLYGLRRNRNMLGKFLVEMPNLGSWVKSNVARWQSTGDWNIKRSSTTTRRRIIRQKYTFSRKGYAAGAFSFLMTRYTYIEPVINNVFCYLGSGKNYRGYANTTWTGKTCTSNCNDVNLGKSCFCRFSAQEGRIGCLTDDGTFEHCDVPKCNSGKVVDVVGCSYTSKTVDGNMLENTRDILRLDRPDAKQACDRMGRECRGIWKDSQNQWRLSRIMADVLPGNHEFLEKEVDCQPYYEEYFSQNFDEI